MCTVVFIPLPGGVLLSSNRDEHPLRDPAGKPAFFQGKFGEMLYPLDPAGKGTWVGANDQGHILVLLNGAFVAHQRQENYRCSRGQVVRALLDQYDALQAYLQMDLHNIEPFTLVLWQNGFLYELVWDGLQRHVCTKDSGQAHMWSSATLYTQEAKAIREQRLKDWLMGNPSLTPSALRAFLTAYNDTENGFVMDRGRVKTLSISTLLQNNEATSFAYFETGTALCHEQCIDTRTNVYGTDKNKMAQAAH